MLRLVRDDDANSHEDAAAGILSKVRVLVVEDHADCRALLRMLLEINGAVCCAVDTVDEALLEIDDFLPDVIVSDLALPERDGFELIRTLREQGCMLPALAITARDDARRRLRTQLNGFQATLGKPFAVDRFIEVVSALARGLGAIGVGVGIHPNAMV